MFTLPPLTAAGVYLTTSPFQPKQVELAKIFIFEHLISFEETLARVWDLIVIRPYYVMTEDHFGSLSTFPESAISLFA